MKKLYFLLSLSIVGYSGLHALTPEEQKIIKQFVQEKSLPSEELNNILKEGMEKFSTDLELFTQRNRLVDLLKNLPSSSQQEFKQFEMDPSQLIEEFKTDPHLAGQAQLYSEVKNIADQIRSSLKDAIQKANSLMLAAVKSSIQAHQSIAPGRFSVDTNFLNKALQERGYIEKVNALNRSTREKLAELAKETERIKNVANARDAASTESFFNSLEQEIL